MAMDGEALVEGSGTPVETGEVETAAAVAAAEAAEGGVREAEGMKGETGMGRHTTSAGGSVASVIDAMGTRGSAGDVGATGIAGLTAIADVTDVAGVMDAVGVADAAGTADVVGATGMVSAADTAGVADVAGMGGTAGVADVEDGAGAAEMADAGGLTFADETQVRVPAQPVEEFVVPVANVGWHAAGVAGPAGSAGSGAAAGSVDGGVVPERLAKLSIPMDEECLALARVTAAHVALLVGLPANRAADLRLAVDEACSLFLAQRPTPEDTRTWWAAGDLELDFARHGTRLHVTVRGPVRFEFDRDDVGWYLLEAMVGEVRADFRPGRGTVTLVEPIPDRIDWGGLD